jgi:3D (Asp-Asp-Asp) domain-containing protein
LALLLIFWAIAGWQGPKIKLFGKLLTKSLENVREDYAKKSCSDFSEAEIKQGYFEALVTGYCKPNPRNFKNRDDFLCAVGLNCSCPNGRNETAGCALGGSLAWSPCHDFDDQTIPYCHQTATGAEPKPGDVAVDWSCFAKGSIVNINERDYRVTDKGAAITGRRADIWFADCQDAFKVIGIYKIRIP